VTKEKKLYRLLFLASVVLLLLNGLYLKYEYHNYLTGKLSDVVGLFAFPYFFSGFLPKRIKIIYVLSGLLFVFWKIELSQPLFDFAHANGFGFDRIVDYSDLFALLMLPISYRYWNTDYKLILHPKKIFKPILISICCFAFLATSQPRKSYRYDYKSDYEMVVTMALDSVKNKLRFYGSESDNQLRYTFELDERRTDIETKVVLEQLKDGQFKNQT